MSGINEMETKYRNKTMNVCYDNQVLKHYVNFIDTLSYRTKYTYTCIIAAFLKSVNKKESELTFDDFNDYMSEIKYKDSSESKTSSYLITVYSALKKFCEYLYVSKRIQENYMQDIKRPKAIEKQETIKKREIGFLTKNEIHKMVSGIEIKAPSDKRELADEWKIRNAAIIYLFLYTGIRCSALISIDIDDIDFQNRILYVTDKGSKVLKFDLTDELFNALLKWENERSKIISYKKEKAFFISNRKQRMSTQSVALMVNTYAKLGKIDHNITPHKLRATYGTHLYNTTGDINFVRDCMGHDSIDTTRLYIRGERKNSKKAAEIMSLII